MKAFAVFYRLADETGQPMIKQWLNQSGHVQISNRQNGIVTMQEHRLPQAIHVASIPPNDIWRIQNAAVTEMKRLSPAAGQYIAEIPPHSWCRKDHSSS